jgi:glycosidase
MTDTSGCNVAEQTGDADSVLELCRRAIALRASNEDIAVGSYRTLPAPEGTWAYARDAGAGAGAVVLLNMSGGAATFEGVQGTVAVSTDVGLEGSACEGALTLGPWLGAVVVVA